MLQADSSLSLSTSRRQILRAIPALAAVATVAAVAASQLLDLIEAHRAAVVAWDLAVERQDALVPIIGGRAAEEQCDLQPFGLELFALMEKICATPVRDMEEARVKAAYMLENIDFEECCDEEFRAFVCSFLA